MKKLEIILYSLIAMALSSCNSFLDEAPRGNAIAETVEQYDEMFNSYSQLINLALFEQDYLYYRNDQLIYTDGSIGTIGYASSFPQSVRADIEFNSDIYQKDENSVIWEKCYNQIYTYNFIINNVMNASGSDIKKKYLLAEARMGRAYIHFLLAQWFALPYDTEHLEELSIPIVTKADTQANNYDRATIKELYTWIVSEMEDACPQLEERDEHPLRCFKATGYSLLAKVYFFMGEYSKALPAVRRAYELLKGDPNVHLTDYNVIQKAYGYKEINMMTLLSIIPYAYKDNESVYCKYVPTMRNYYLPYYGMESTDYLKPEVYALFDEHDLRKNLIITKDSKGNALAYPCSTLYNAQTNLGCKIAEVYLMLAECEARVGSLVEARKILTEFRKYRMLTGYESIPDNVQTKEQLVKYCLREEDCEFAGGDYRYLNIRRLWNDPLFQDQKPITHYIGKEVYTLQESQLKINYPETVLIWNESWRN